MKTIDFVRDQNAVNAWLATETSLLEEQECFVSSWPHGDTPGFGLVIVDFDANSGELHLMADGSVTWQVEQDRSVIAGEHHEPTDLITFTKLFESFKNRIRSHAS